MVTGVLQDDGRRGVYRTVTSAGYAVAVDDAGYPGTMADAGY